MKHCKSLYFLVAIVFFFSCAEKEELTLPVAYTGNISNVTVTTPLTKYLDSLWPLDNLFGQELEHARGWFGIRDTIVLPNSGDSMFIINYPYTEQGEPGEGRRGIVIHSNFSKKYFFITHSLYSLSVRSLLDSANGGYSNALPTFHQLSDYLDELFTRGYNPTISMFTTLCETFLYALKTGCLRIGPIYTRLTSEAQIDSIKATLSQPKSPLKNITYHKSRFGYGLEKNSLLNIGFEVAAASLPITDSSMVAVYYEETFPSLTFFIITPIINTYQRSFSPSKLRADNSVFTKKKVYHGIYNFSTLSYY